MISIELTLIFALHIDKPKLWNDNAKAAVDICDGLYFKNGSAFNNDNSQRYFAKHCTFSGISIKHDKRFMKFNGVAEPRSKDNTFNINFSIRRICCFVYVSV